MDDGSLHLATVVVSAGRGARRPGDPFTTPVTFASVFRAGGEIAYGREGNPTWEALEEALGLLEGGRALAFASGIAAIAAVLEELPPAAVVVAPRNGYSGMRALLVDAERRCRLRDNMLATPLVQRPLEHGADLVVHSITKFLAGHSDVVLGAVITPDPTWRERLHRRRTITGAIPGPMEAFLALRGMRTLDLRMERAQRTAGELAHRLAAHPAIRRVRYPGLAEDPGHERAARQMRGFGALLSVEVVGGRAAADAVCDAVRLLVPATSLGGVETSLERRNRWPGEEAVPTALLRISVGCEHIDDLWQDLQAGLSAAIAVACRPPAEGYG
ncbi:MAG: PLP-dependent transferase [Nitriliruptorales bacterium]|nr:PLP-dependent transferase [Nitriliruptorales bacterium]